MGAPVLNVELLLDCGSGSSGGTKQLRLWKTSLAWKGRTLFSRWRPTEPVNEPRVSVKNESNQELPDGGGYQGCWPLLLLFLRTHWIPPSGPDQIWRSTCCDRLLILIGWLLQTKSVHSHACTKSMQTHFKRTPESGWMLHCSRARRVHVNVASAWVSGGLKRWTTSAVSAFMPFTSSSECLVLNEQWNVVIFLTSEVILMLVLHPKLLAVIYLGSLLINYGHLTCQWSRFSEVAVKMMVWMAEPAVPLTLAAVLTDNSSSFTLMEEITLRFSCSFNDLSPPNFIVSLKLETGEMMRDQMKRRQDVMKETCSDIGDNVPTGALESHKSGTL